LEAVAGATVGKIVADILTRDCQGFFIIEPHLSAVFLTTIQAKKPLLVSATSSSMVAASNDYWMSVPAQSTN